MPPGHPAVQGGVRPSRSRPMRTMPRLPPDRGLCDGRQAIGHPPRRPRLLAPPPADVGEQGSRPPARHADPGL